MHQTVGISRIIDVRTSTAASLMYASIPVHWFAMHSDVRVIARRETHVPSFMCMNVLTLPILALVLSVIGAVWDISSAPLE